MTLTQTPTDYGTEYTLDVAVAKPDELRAFMETLTVEQVFALEACIVVFRVGEHITTDRMTKAADGYIEEYIRHRLADLIGQAIVRKLAP